MKMNRVFLPAFALLLGITGLTTPKTAAALPGSAPAQDRDHDRDRDRDGWDMPPRELNEIQRRGFHDGVEGARRDFESHRQPNVENRDEYRRPQLPDEAREAYRDGYRRGYQAGVSHLFVAVQPERRPEPIVQAMIHAWEPVPDRASEIERRGYQDGQVGAQKDADNHRRPDPNNRDEYRTPPVPPQLVDEYREGFRRGYEEVVSQRMGVADRGPWDAIPDR